MYNHELKESIDFPGYYEIPGYSNYVISIDGRVINKTTRINLEGSRNPDGYVNYRIFGDDNYTLTWGRHRLLCYVFKHPGVDITSLVVNHINTVKGDDWLDNLEWTTYQGNAEHAGAMGITPKCIPISVRDIDTGNIRKFPSIIECARFMGMSKDAINYRIFVGEERVFPERKQYRGSHSNEPWIIPISVEQALLQNSTSKAISVRNVLTGEIATYNQMSELAKDLDIALPTLSQWIRREDQPVLPNFIQIRWAHDLTPWREVIDPYLELNNFSCSRCVKVVNNENGEFKIYPSAVECAKWHRLTTTALNYRLKSNGEKVFSDGYRYGYYPY
jgi:hypothetical protein